MQSTHGNKEIRLVSLEKLHLAEDTYWKIIYGINRSKFKHLVFPAFNDYIGCIPLYFKGLKSLEVTKEAYERIEMLLSSHAKALIQVWAIRRGIIK